MLNRLNPLLLILAVVAALTGCATNPATGERDLVLMSEQAEIALGRKNHPKIVEHYGKYDDAGLQAYVQRVGASLARRSHRDDLIYRFTVLDSPDVNAFALPGGYIYITRGMLAHLNSEAQLAAVLGHEIGHVTARHTVRQHSTATAVGLVGAILAGKASTQGAQDLANVVGTAVVRGYGREHELEADRLGAEYMARSDYDPHAMIEVIRTLKAQETFAKKVAETENREPQAYHGLFSTHPDNDKRLQQIVAGARADYRGDRGRIGRDAYLDAVDDLVYGDSERSGIRRGNHFYHKPLGFAVDFPRGWRIDNQSDRLLAIAPGGEALVQLSATDLNKRISPRRFMTERLDLEVTHGEPVHQHGLEGHTGVATVDSPFGRRPTRITVIYFRNKAYIIAGAAKDSRNPLKYERQFIDTARSFRPLTDSERKQARPLRLDIVAAGEDTRFAELAAQSRLPNHPEDHLRLLNGYYPTGQPEAGHRLKVVR